MKKSTLKFPRAKSTVSKLLLLANQQYKNPKNLHFNHQIDQIIKKNIDNLHLSIK